MNFSRALHKELRTAVTSRNKKTPTVQAGSRSISGGVSIASQRSSIQLAGKRKANELASSGDCSEPTIRSPAPGAGSAPLPATSTESPGEQDAISGPQIGSSEGGVTYAVVAVGPVAPHKPSGSLTPTAQGFGSVRTCCLL
jgi:hypothetical protein